MDDLFFCSKSFLFRYKMVQKKLTSVLGGGSGKKLVENMESSFIFSLSNHTSLFQQVGFCKGQKKLY